MLERFTKPARAVIDRAVVIATESRSDQVRPEHLLAAVLGDDSCLAVRLLRQEGWSVDRMHEELDRRRNRYLDGLDEDDAAALAGFGIDLAAVVDRIEGDRAAPPRRRPRFSRAAKKVLELAVREAASLEDSFFGTEHLLLGLAREGDPTVGGSLAAGGADLDRLRQAVAAAERRAG